MVWLEQRIMGQLGKTLVKMKLGRWGVVRQEPVPVAAPGRIICSYYTILPRGPPCPRPAQANGVGQSRKPTLPPKSGCKANIPVRSTFRFICYDWNSFVTQVAAA